MPGSLSRLELAWSVVLIRKAGGGLTFHRPGRLRAFSSGALTIISLVVKKARNRVSGKIAMQNLMSTQSGPNNYQDI